MKPSRHPDDWGWLDTAIVGGFALFAAVCLLVFGLRKAGAAVVQLVRWAWRAVR